MCVWHSLWEFVVCAAALSMVVPFCGIPALIFAVRSRVFYRQGDVNASRSANLSALRLITVGGVCLCVLAVTASILLAVFDHDNVGSPSMPSTQTAAASTVFAGSAGRRRPQGVQSLSSNAFEKALRRHEHEALNKQPRPTNNNFPRQSGGLGSLIRNAGRAQFSGLRSTAGTTVKPRFESALMRRPRTWND